MKIEQTHWQLPDNCPVTPGLVVTEAQPEIGIGVLWNEPDKWWKPLLVITIWTWRLSIGWLAGNSFEMLEAAFAARKEKK